MGRGLLEGWHLVVLLVVVLLLFGAKRLPDSARSLGRSMRIFKSEMREMGDDSRSDHTRSDRAGSTPRAAEPQVQPLPPVPLEGRVTDRPAGPVAGVDAPAPDRRD